MATSLAAVFSANMVLQRGRRIPVWGWDEPGATVRVALAGRRVRTRTGADGPWQARLPALDAGGPFELVVRGSAEVVFPNVMVGEVWVCSGQSNMEWPLSLIERAEAELPNANFPGVRLFTVPKVTAEQPLADVANAAWQVCSPATAPAFSAVAYCFGRELHRRLGVAVGLINTSWGGTLAESWTSRAGLLAAPDLKRLVEDYEALLPHLAEANAARQQEVEAIEARTRDSENAGWARGWADLPAPAGDWQAMSLPCSWQSAGLNYSGVLWFRKEVEVPAAWAGQPLALSIGATDKSDTTYFNNVRVGGVTMQDRPDAWCFQRTYPVPAAAVRAGRNVIAVRVHSNMYSGGMTGPAAAMQLTCPAVPNAAAVPLAGPWRYAVEQNYGLVTIPPMPPGPGNPNSPCSLFNGMIAPLLPYACRGAIWYQGESNVDRARQYRTLFQILIRDWRRQWQDRQFAFLFVQLANYLACPATPAESPWAELREAQTLALRLPQTGMAVAIDIGAADDIHPRNKQEVGRRLALNALAKVYADASVVPCGPLYRAARVEGGAMRLTFDHVGGGLVCRGERLAGFAIAGRNRRFVWADARIDPATGEGGEAADTVLVSSPAVPKPVAVRYGWADNPPCTLYNAAGLPASPFRTDRWPGVTA